MTAQRTAPAYPKPIDYDGAWWKQSPEMNWDLYATYTDNCGRRWEWADTATDDDSPLMECVSTTEPLAPLPTLAAKYGPLERDVW